MAIRFATLTQRLPARMFGRYIVVGLCNTLFAYGTFALFTAILNPYIPASYLAAGLLSSVLNISFSFLGYKWFVFRTKGHYVREWARCLVVYGGNIALGLALLPPTVFLVARVTGQAHSAPYIAGAILLGVQAVFSFVGHRRYSFNRAGQESDEQ